MQGSKDIVAFTSSGSGTYTASYKAKLLGPYTFSVWQANQGGLKGDYWENVWHSGTVESTKLNSTLNLVWGSLVTPYAGTYVSAAWEGFIKASYSETYTFYIWADDAVKVLLGQETLIDMWDVCCNEGSGARSMTAGELVHISVSWMQLQGEAKIKLEWKSFSQARQVIPSTALYYLEYIQDTPVQKDVDQGKSTASLCYVNNLVASMTAGQSYTIELYSVDANGNALSNPGDVFTLTFSGAASKTIDSAYDTDNRSNAAIVLTTAGTYSLDIQLYGTSIKNSPFSVKATAGTLSSAKSSTNLSTLIASGSLVANTGYSFAYSARDSYENSLTTSNASIVVTITWQSTYYTSPIGVTRPTDYDLKYGINYSGYADESSISFRIPRTAVYSISIKVNDAQLGTSTTMTIVPSTIYPAKSVPVYPSSSVLTAGSTYTVKVQGRDAYYNTIKSTVSSLTSTSMSATGPATLTTSMTDDGSNLGVYKGSLTFEKVGEYTISLSINGEAISNPTTTVTVSVGTSISTSKSEVTGLPSSVYVGASFSGTVYLRDAYSNTLTSYSGTLAVAVSGAESAAPTLTKNSDGSYSFTFTPSTTGTDSVSVTYNSNPITPTPKSFTVTPSHVTAAKSSFQTFSTTNIVGQPKLKISARDSTGNTITNPVNDVRMLPQAFSANFKGPKTYDISAKYDDLTDYLIDLETLVTAGDYSVVLSLLQQGGLQAFYYTSTDFTSLSGSLSTYNHAGTTPTTYTKVETTIDLNWGTAGPTEFSSSQTDNFSVVWEGFVRANYTETVTFYVTCSDLVRLTLGGSVLFNSLSSSTEVNSQSATASLVKHKFYEIKLEYVERLDSANVKLEWSSNSITRAVIPSANLFSKLNTDGSPYSLTLSPGDTAPSQCSLSDGSSNQQSYTANTYNEKTIQLTARDSYGNVKADSNEDFTATLISSKSSANVAVTGVSNGIYSLSFTATTTGTYNLRVYFLNGGGLNEFVTAATVVVKLSSVDSSKSEIEGNPDMRAGLASLYLLRTKTSFGEYLTTGGETIEATVSGVTNRQVPTDNIKVSDNGNGSYYIAVTIEELNSYTLEATVNGGVAVSKELTVTYGLVDETASTVTTNEPIVRRKIGRGRYSHSGSGPR